MGPRLSLSDGSPSLSLSPTSTPLSSSEFTCVGALLRSLMLDMDTLDDTVAVPLGVLDSLVQLELDPWSGVNG